MALHPVDGPGAYPSDVRHVVRKDELADYYRAARALENCGAQVVSIQHEYGIWGGESGAYVLDFVRQLRQPVVVTLHTVLRNPSPAQRRVLSELIHLSAASVAMSRAAATLLVRAYGVNLDRVEVIPHGVPDLRRADPAAAKRELGLEDGPMILSFGLLGPGKGYEAAIESIPAVVSRFPNARYVVLGATHPEMLRREGEVYRRSLEDRARRLGVSEHILFVNRFVDSDELGRWLGAADIFVTPYPNLEQIVSGTLSYAMGAGRAIVSTPYAYAAEMLADGRGWLVDQATPDVLSAELAEAFVALLGDDELRTAYGRRAYLYSRSMVWPQVGARYRELFGRVVAGRTAADASAAVGVLRG